jgi:5-methylthioadenosine/S-adenosylhomocysteine deaminase
MPPPEPDRPDLILTNALIVTVDAGFTVIPDGAVAVRGGRLAAIGPAATIGRDAAEVIDAGGAILMPGLVNSHCHAADSLFRCLVEDLPLEPWLQTVWKAEAAILNRNTVRLGATLGLAELLLSGVTTVMDMFWFPEEGARAARELGMRIATGGIFIDFPGVDHVTHDDRLRAARDFFAEFHGADDVFPTIMPHGTYTVSPDNLTSAKALAEERGALFSTHAAETRAEQSDIDTRYGRSVIRHLDHLGLLDPRTVLAHCVWLDDAEIEILARTGASVSHNPVSNLKLASGIARVPDLLGAGVRVTVGTDGAISGNDLDMWMALRLAATLHRGATHRADAVSTRAALAMVTREGATALGALDRIGSLEVGKFADMILIDTDRVHATPMFDPMTHIVFSTAKSDVRDVFVGGRRVVRDGALTGVDIAETLARVHALTPSIAASIA